MSKVSELAAVKSPVLRQEFSDADRRSKGRKRIQDYVRKNRDVVLSALQSATVGDEIEPETFYAAMVDVLPETDFVDTSKDTPIARQFTSTVLGEIRTLASIMAIQSVTDADKADKLAYFHSLAEVAQFGIKQASQNRSERLVAASEWLARF